MNGTCVLDQYTCLSVVGDERTLSGAYVGAPKSTRHESLAFYGYFQGSAISVAQSPVRNLFGKHIFDLSYAVQKNTHHAQGWVDMELAVKAACRLVRSALSGTASNAA